MKTIARIAAATAALMLIAAAGQASAAVFTYSPGPQTGSDGAINGQAVITTGANSLTIALTSLVNNPTSIGQEVSGIQITLANVPGTVTLFSKSGVLIDGDGNPVGGVIDHWGTTISGGVIYLATAGTGAPGGSPYDLITGSAPYTNGNASIDVHSPSIQNTGTFVLNLTGAPNPIITGVKIEFGTQPESIINAVCTAGCGAVPEPATWSMLIVGFGLIGAGMRRRRSLGALGRAYLA
jgi:hypothetical protein